MVTGTTRDRIRVSALWRLAAERYRFRLRAYGRLRRRPHGPPAHRIPSADECRLYLQPLRAR